MFALSHMSDAKHAAHPIRRRGTAPTCTSLSVIRSALRHPMLVDEPSGDCFAALGRVAVAFGRADDAALQHDVELPGERLRVAQASQFRARSHHLPHTVEMGDAGLTDAAFRSHLE